MIEQTQHGDVTALRLSWRRSRLVGYSVHAYVVRGALIDSGFPGVEREVLAFAKSTAVRGAFITHEHEDHAGNVEALARAGVPLAMDDATFALVQAPGSIGLYRHVIWSAMRPLRTPHVPFVDEQLVLVATPGHCRNHHAVWDAATGTLFSGDLFLGVKVRVSHLHEQPRALVASLRRVVDLSPQRMFCAHRGLVANASSLLAAKADWLENLIGDTDRLIDAGVSDSGIAKQLVGPTTLTHYFSAGDYSAVNVVRSIRASRPA